MSTMYIVATPIGNLDDISKRAIDTLQSVSMIIAEDTRVISKLLARFGIKTRAESYHQHSSDDKKLFILQELLNGKDIALVTDAGTPGIADPGNELIDFIMENSSGISVVPIPGPSASAAALSVCGLKISEYVFLGFWPKKKVTKTIDKLRTINIPFVFFDSPHRVVRNLEKIALELGDRRVFVGRELTKLHETHYRGRMSEVIGGLKKEEHLRGEIVVVVE